MRIFEIFEEVVKLSVTNDKVIETISIGHDLQVFPYARGIGKPKSIEENEYQLHPKKLKAESRLLLSKA